METLEFTNLLVDTIVDKKGSDVLLLDMKEQCIFADYFLLCNGDNTRQIRALTDSLVGEAKQQAQEIPLHVEGTQDDGWMLIDYGHVVVHIFAPERREYYNLEELWHEARVVVKMQ